MIGNSTNWGHPGAEVTPGGTGAAQAAGGSFLVTLGIKSAGFVPILYNDPQDLITGIDGSNTWTGTAQSDGPWLRYKLDKDPGGNSCSRLPVLYTLVARQ